ncbi:MAG: 4-hydroxythreonine-4-phosphate dehydrogenase PdxA [Candidatus Nitronauta litoralis]|uniref:4-hydroxythreonine-4-phosphate dehydrogenase PdxA n=1 Tax=Candidatus Nitronauta litoralis TaxID=2705533 RepID=A0A7T0BW81_9BACT|nr:MAG: 4-hydroxythreonine-4-phosphate dehydrogenase PdxA [Candidatus Nitronauta litoralis]
MEPLPRLAITMGDPAGVGPEIIIKALHTRPDSCRPVIIGDQKILQNTARYLELPDALDDVQVIDLDNVPDSLTTGAPTRESGAASVSYIKTAVDLALKQEVDAIVTAPISKEAINLAGYNYPGHTELLADLTDVPYSLLMLASDEMRVVLTTTHVALSDIKPLITHERVLRTLKLTHQWLAGIGIKLPRIAVTGLNPHCGDGGVFGKEEEESIIPAIKEAQASGLAIAGPFSADALFGRYQAGQYDTIVTMYHDQGMIPIKMASQDRAVNVTLGLPIIRTSVDHGTAYDIAGTGMAKPDSLLHALNLAARLAQRTMGTN